ncbi:MAG: diguanylate cyclase [Planctomycetaceae bacterium]|nr:diguanylate cyclase [Planctomycetaceae bacterium]
MPAPLVIAADLDLFQEAFDHASTGMAFVALDGSIVKANAALCRILGYSEDDLIAIGWEAVTHPEDLAVDVERACRLFSGAIESYELEKRYFHKRGHIIWTRLTASLLRGGDQPIFLGQVQEITQFKCSEQSVSAANVRLAELIEHLGAGVLVEDDRRRIRLANSTLCRLLELTITPSHLAGRHSDELGNEIADIARDPADFTTRLAELRARRVETRGEKLDLSDGRTLERDYVPLESHGEPRGQMWVYRDVTNRVEAEKFNHEQNSRLRESNGRLAALAATDSLTGLPNRRSLHERLVAALRQSARDGLPVSLALLDVDHFKEFNDRFGHPAGDEVLKALAGLFRQVVRMGDVPARFGGEEFAILLPRTEAIEAIRVAEHCRHALERAAWPLRPVTASFGVATIPPSSMNEDAAAHVLIAAADAALYRSKAAGRNRVTHAEDPFGE